MAASFESCGDEGHLSDCWEKAPARSDTWDWEDVEDLEDLLLLLFPVFL